MRSRAKAGAHRSNPLKLGNQERRWVEGESYLIHGRHHLAYPRLLMSTRQDIFRHTSDSLPSNLPNNTASLPATTSHASLIPTLRPRLTALHHQRTRKWNRNPNLAPATHKQERNPALRACQASHPLTPRPRTSRRRPSERIRNLTSLAWRHRIARASPRISGICLRHPALSATPPSPESLRPTCKTC